MHTRETSRELAIIENYREVFLIHSHPAIVLLLETMLADHASSSTVLRPLLRPAALDEREERTRLGSKRSRDRVKEK